ncbi:hypothetical protein ACVCNR_21020 (plasmid) [Aquamicrobium terrae]
MSGPEIATLLVVEIICGTAGAMAVARLWREIDLGWRSIAVIGMLGGVVLTLLAAQIPGVGRFVGHVENVIDAASRGTGGLTPTVLVGAGVAGLLGGVISISLVAFLRRAGSPRR